LPSASGAQQPNDLALLGVAPELGLLEQWHPILRHFESPTGAGAKLHVRIGELLSELGRQPGSPVLVVSNRAVFDRDGHDGLLSRIRW
jgi:hypothetical protein